jgi:hypothetical protein
MGIGLDFVITGLEHSGTTLVSELFRQVPGCDSGWECGVLLGETPRDFPANREFYENISPRWLITEPDLAQACDTDSFSEFYRRLYSFSDLFRQESPIIRFDKTPRYILDLPRIARIVQAPIVVMMKDPRAIIWSDFRRSNYNISRIGEWYDSWIPNKLCYMERAYQNYLYAWQDRQCLVVRLEEVCLEMHATLAKMFAHVGLEFSLKYLHIRHRRYPESRGEHISVADVFSYFDGLPDEIQARVMADLGHLRKWFFSLD